MLWCNLISVDKFLTSKKAGDLFERGGGRNIGFTICFHICEVNGF